jgi:hypothetical protein
VLATSSDRSAEVLMNSRSTLTRARIALRYIGVEKLRNKAVSQWMIEEQRIDKGERSTHVIALMK